MMMKEPFKTWMISDVRIFNNDYRQMIAVAEQYKAYFQIFMLREKDAVEEERYELIKALRAKLKDCKIILNWNGRDQVENWPLDGLHLGVMVWKNPEVFEQRLHRLKALSLSLAIHSLDEWQLAKQMGYEPETCILSPVFPTTCKDQAEALGIAKAARLANEIHRDFPGCSVIAMGGIQLGSYDKSLKSSFDGVAIRSGWMNGKTLTISK